VTPGKALGYSELYLDFVSGRETARHFYTPDNLSAVAARLDGAVYARDRTADILRRQNQAWGAGEPTLAAIERLRDPRAVAVFAGQQAGLFGGPLLVQIKALGIIQAARRIGRELGRPAVPIFWIAADDHDFAEINHTWVPDRAAAEPVKIVYPTAPAEAAPAAEIRFADAEALAAAKARLREALGETEFTPALYGLIDRCYTPEETFVGAFAKLMTALLGEFGLVLFSPADPEAKALAAPLLQALAERHEEVRALVGRTNENLRSHGYHVQVEKKDESVHLFFARDGRRPVLRQSGGGFRIGDRAVTAADLRAMIAQEPERFSPDVLTRPVMQSWLFPAAAQHGGPSEIAYFAQVTPLFELFGRPAPVYRARPSATFVERRYEAMMAQHRITLEELAGDIEQVVNRVTAESFPPDLEQAFGEARREVRERFEALAAQTLGFDPQLQSAAAQAAGRIDFQIVQFEGKVFAAHKRRLGEVRERLYRLHRVLYPHRGLQERALNIGYFLAKFGPAFVRFAHERLDSETAAHQLIPLSDV